MNLSPADVTRGNQNGSSTPLENPAFETQRPGAEPVAHVSNPAGFEEAYAGTPPWDIGRPQPAFLQIAQAGALRGRVLDIGCGTGEHALMAAALGLEAVGIDSAPTAIKLAEEKARTRNLAARFILADALNIAQLGEQYDTVLDCGLFHTFDDPDRIRYEAGLRSAVASGGRYYLLCFSDLQPGAMGPRRVSQAEIRACFATGWRVESIDAATIAVNPGILPDDPRAWLALIVRT